MQTNTTRKREQGQAILGVVILFVVILTTVVLGVTTPTWRQVQISRDEGESFQSYLTSESLAEDLAYRLKTGKTTATNNTLTIGNSTASASITSSLGTQDIKSTGTNDALARTVEIKMTQGTGIAFNYGTQTGNGGFVLNNNAGVIGNIYSNGSITGSSGAYITGTAVAADSSASTADQTNDSPASPPASITFAKTASDQDFGQSFQVSSTNVAGSVSFYIEKVGAPSNVTVNITADNAGSPASSALASASLSASLITTSYGWVTVNLPTGVTLNSGTTYWIVIDATNNTNNYYVLGANAAYANGVAKTGKYGGSWNVTGLDGYFRFYTGGQTASINNVTVGSAGVGDAWAHAVSGSTIAGNNYCQTGGGNNKACDTSKGDPSPQQYPVSDGNITDWKTAAAAGTVIAGNYTVSTTSSLGPAKITGNLAINGTLQLTGVVWVVGNITTSNGAQVKLDSSFGNDGAVLLSDGLINLSNNVAFSGSGQSGSYVMLLTTSDCPNDVSCGGSNAVELSNNSSSVIIIAENGTVHVSNNGGANEITANKLSIDNNATITYQTGLANSVFTTGPAGGYNINSWKEVQ